jgi:hypothetical protein
MGVGLGNRKGLTGVKGKFFQQKAIIAKRNVRETDRLVFADY